MRRPEIIILFLIAVILALAAWYDELSVELSTGGNDLFTLEMQIDKLKTENSLLQEEILMAEALTTINGKALKAGFVPASYIILK